MRPVTFVVGTGRSGSSELSRILNLHPGVLSLNEMLSALTPNALPEGTLDGEEFWAILSEPQETFERMIRSQAPLPEFLYPKNPGRFSSEDGGIPGIALMTLPLLTDDTDALYDRLEPLVRSWPERDARGHYEALFDVLCADLGREVVVERSGYSTWWIPRLREVFPDARFVHLYRQGPDCAMSMSLHPGYRMLHRLHEVVELAGVEGIADLGPEHMAALPPHLRGLFADPFERSLLMDPDMPIEGFGRLWSMQVIQASEELAKLPSERHTTLAYEDLLDDPRGELTRLAEFAGTGPDEAWLATATARLDPSRRGAALSLPVEDRAALWEACAPGEAAITSSRA
ncbi:hypothetical protein Afil01_44630 [Actinorhabdospora filicis]|uniref:Sulfotransferase n=1 Tax=Actinorhabdospora filicis TaxID=1785913 RepID=A0A9W6WBK3_9ACTN|nr:sulfotransferase [Actinorhabdospora filicis]GLZ79656.1 hypothetical protein Afil01_44630 [Actinorhabdospora filicis]